MQTEHIPEFTQSISVVSLLVFYLLHQLRGTPATSLQVVVVDVIGGQMFSINLERAAVSTSNFY